MRARAPQPARRTGRGVLEQSSSRGFARIVYEGAGAPTRAANRARSARAELFARVRAGSEPCWAGRVPRVPSSGNSHAHAAPRGHRRWAQMAAAAGAARRPAHAEGLRGCAWRSCTRAGWIGMARARGGAALSDRVLRAPAIGRWRVSSLPDELVAKCRGRVAGAAVERAITAHGARQPRRVRGARGAGLERAPELASPRRAPRERAGADSRHAIGPRGSLAFLLAGARVSFVALVFPRLMHMRRPLRRASCMAPATV
jgi:hypothetical protein